MKRALVAVAVTNLLTAVMFMGMGKLEAHQTAKGLKPEMPQCQHMMMNKLGKADKNYDLRFMNAMISHHEGAIMMAKDAKQKTQHQEIKTLSQNIIESQQKEIDQMKAWRKAWYGSK